MNICIFTRSTTAHKSSGGMETQTQILAEGLKNWGHRVVILTTQHPADLEKEVVNGLVTYYLSDTPSGVYSKQFFFKSSQKFEELYKKSPFDVVLSVSDGSFGYAIRLKTKLKVPLVIILHGTLLGEIKTQLKNISSVKDLLFFTFRIVPFGIYTYFFRDLRHLRLADFVIAVSNSVKEAIKREYIINKKKIFVVFNGVDTKKFNPELRWALGKRSKLRESLGIANAEKVLLYLGRLEKEKGVYLLLEAFATVSSKYGKIELLIVGSGSEEKNFLQKAKILGVASKLKFLGTVPYDDTPKYYNAADLFVFPTLRYEGFPMSVVEAMACGSPVIASRMGGIPEAVESGVTGHLIDPGSVKALAEGILELLEDTDLLSEMSRKAREISETKFSQETMVKETLKVLNKASRPKRLSLTTEA